jgi:hypothetical protein
VGSVAERRRLRGAKDWVIAVIARHRVIGKPEALSSVIRRSRDRASPQCRNMVKTSQARVPVPHFIVAAKKDQPSYALAGP